MQIQINTDHNIKSHEALAAHLSSIVESALSEPSQRSHHASGSPPEPMRTATRSTAMTTCVA
jgi:hypothetical protein